MENTLCLEFVSVYGREIHMHFKRIPIGDLPKVRAENVFCATDIFFRSDKYLLERLHRYIVYNETVSGTVSTTLRMVRSPPPKSVTLH